MLRLFEHTLVNGDLDDELTMMEQLYQASNSMSNYAMVEHTVHFSDQLWEF